MPDLIVIVCVALSVGLAHGANARLARLFTEDEITQPIRTWVTAKLGADHLLARWLECPWCLGWWTAWPVTAVAWFPIMGSHLPTVFVLAAWSVAHAAGRLNHNHGS